MNSDTKEVKSHYPKAQTNVGSIENLIVELEKTVEAAGKVFTAKKINDIAQANTILQEEITSLLSDLEKHEEAAGIKEISTSFSKSVAKSDTAIGSEKKIEVKETVPKKEKPAKINNKAPAVEDTIDIGRLDLRVGRIIKAERHPDAEALYLETIDLGEDKPRTVISGLVKHIPLDQMQNRLVVCLCNLKPAKMRGIESQAMVMCASTPDKVEIMEVDPSCKPGQKLLCGSYVNRPDAVLNPKKKIWETCAPDLKVNTDGKATYKGEVVTVEGGTFMTAPTLKDVFIK
uniref:tRNA-binding domain-containing protein n=1 Tax=Rhabditophanes sp. KR3021 TaxID=114890 RepID=A0AC35TK46_9BILA